MLQLRVRAVDSANPLLYDEEDVSITIRRNVNSPVFTRQTYTVQVSERADIGSQIIAITATDADLVSGLSCCSSRVYSGLSCCNSHVYSGLSCCSSHVYSALNCPAVVAMFTVACPIAIAMFTVS